MKLTRTPTVALILLAIASPLRAASPPDGWRQLFNGKDKAGWKMCGPGEFRVEDGCLVSYGGMGLLWYEKEKLANCEIKAVFKLAKPTDNSGVYIRIRDKPADDPWYAVHNGYEVQILNGGDQAHSTGSIYSFTPAGSLITLKPGEWVTYVIRLEGDTTTLSVNGVVTATRKEGDPAPPKGSAYDPDRGPRAQSGYIGIQNHDETSKVVFKEISVRPLAKK